MKQQFTREDLLDAALAIVREEGYEAVTMRSVAERAGCSVQPLYSLFGDKQALMAALCAHGLAWVERYNAAHAADGSNAFSSHGLAHLRIAQQEPNLFSLLYLSSYVEVSSMDDLLSVAEQPGLRDEIMALWGLDEEAARELYLDMVVYTHGLAVLIVAGARFTDDELRERMNSAFAAFAAKAGIPLKGASHDD